MKVDATLNAAEWTVLPDVARRREAGHDGAWNDGRSLAGRAVTVMRPAPASAWMSSPAVSGVQPGVVNTDPSATPG